MQDKILDLALEVSKITSEKVTLIEQIMRQTGLLSLNARIEAGRAGAAGAAFGVVAAEMGVVSSQVSAVSKELRAAVDDNVTRIKEAGAELVAEFRGARFTDLALNAIEIIDRNLYERSCDVRWWATDSAVVDALQDPTAERLAYAADRLATILRSYTVYLDLWVIDRNGIVVANGRPGAYRRAVGANVAHEAWFRNAMALTSGDDFVVADVAANPVLDGAASATYATAIRKGGAANGRPLGVLGIFFDWAPQAAAVVEGVALSDEERAQARALLLDAEGRVIAASDGAGILSEVFTLRTEGRPRGHYVEPERVVAFARTPGYETYKGLGWYGAIEYRLEA